MSEKEPQFTVKDRRKFTSEGELRETAPEEEAGAAAPPPPQAQPSPAQPAPAEPAPGPRLVTTEAATENEPELEPLPTAEETARQHAEYQKSSRELDNLLRQANPGAPASEPMSFEHLVQSIYLSAVVQMGLTTQPGEKPRIDIVGARQNIDILGVLSDKTKGNLNERERNLLENALFDLRMSFLELTNAIAGQAVRPPTPGGKL